MAKEEYKQLTFSDVGMKAAGAAKMTDKFKKVTKFRTWIY
jgi:hypothetical protein